MSRGYGRWERRILDAVAKSDRLIPFHAASRSEHAAILRAAKRLQSLELCLIVRVWNEQYTRIIPTVCRPGLTIDGKPAAELSVAFVPCGTKTAHIGSIRQLAKQEGVSKSQIHRDLAKANEENMRLAPAQPATARERRRNHPCPTG